MIAGRFKCPTCPKRLYWCRYCRVQHCSQCAPHPSRARKYLAKNLVIQKRNGQCLIMSARRYAHLRGASKGGQVTATRPNAGRFTPETARKAARKAWDGRWRLSRGGNGRATPLRIGRPRKNRPAVDRAHLRACYTDLPRLGLWFSSVDLCWYIKPLRRISERAVLKRLGLIPTYTKNWVPGDDEPIIKTTVGRLPAMKRARGGHHGN